MIKWPEPVMHGLKAAAGRYGNICYSTLAMAEHSIKHNPPSVGYTAVSYCTESQLKQAVRDAYEEAAKVVAPKTPRPCACESCDCGNRDDAQRVAEWDAENAAASAIRALIKEIEACVK